MCIQLSKTSRSPGGSSGSSQRSQQPLGISDKYAIALKTPSFEEFSKQVYSAISGDYLGDLLFPDNELLNPILLHHANNEPEEISTMLSSYFANSETAFKICGVLLKSTNTARESYESVQSVLDLVGITENINEEQCRLISTEFVSFTERENPFEQAPFEGICESFQNLRQQLDLKHEIVANKLRFVSRAKSFFTESVILLRKKNAQLNAAVKGCFVLKTQLETTKMLVARVYDEVEQSKNRIRICERRNYEIYPVQEVVRVLQKNESQYRERLDEIGEQACMCLLNINRARSLLLQEIRIE